MNITTCAQVRKKSEQLGYCRRIKCHIYGATNGMVQLSKSMPISASARIEFASSSAIGTEETINHLAGLSIPYAALVGGNVGGKVWSKLKPNEDILPACSELQKCPFWLDVSNYGRILNTPCSAACTDS